MSNTNDIHDQILRLLVATHAHLMVIDIDSQFEIKRRQVLQSGHHYGIALLPNESSRFLVKHGDQKLTLYGEEEGVNVLGDLAFRHQVGDIHQVAYANDGVYMANTKYNSVIYQSMQGRTDHEYHFQDRTDGINHVNSVFPCDSHVVTLLHNKDREPSQVVVLYHDLDRGFKPVQVIGLGHFGCHNIFLDQRYLYYNASRAGKFVVVDTRHPAVLRELEFPGHVKGMSATVRYLIIGYSAHASRHERVHSPGYLAIIDRSTLESVATIDLNGHGPVGNINEIRCLSEYDFAHAGRASDVVNLRSFQLLRESVLQRYRRMVITKLRSHKHIADLSGTDGPSYRSPK